MSVSALRRLPIMVLTLAGLGVAGAAPEAEARHRVLCDAPGGGELVAASDQARLESTGRLGPIHGCLYRDDRPRRLARRAVGVRTAGVFAALVELRSNASIVKVFDLRTGRTVFASEPQVAVTDIELAANGSVAWIARVSEERAIHRVHTGGAAGERILDADEGVQPHSLALAGSTLYWTAATAARSASLETQTAAPSPQDSVLPARQPGRCFMRGATGTLWASERGLVAQREDGRAFACLYDRGRIRSLGTGVRRTSLTTFLLAYAMRERVRGRTRETVRVMDLRSGRLRQRILPPRRSGSPAYRVVDVLAHRSAAVAWIYKVTSPELSTFEVRRAVPGGRAELLETNPDIDPSSLAVAGNTLYWTRAGLPTSTRVPEPGQELAAEALDLSLSTYMPHLRRAIGPALAGPVRTEMTSSQPARS